MKNVADKHDDPLVKGSILGAEATFLVDTGANITIVKPAVLDRILETQCPMLEQVKTKRLLTDGVE